MDGNISFAIAFVLGLSSSFHCIGMCGPIITALSLGAAPPGLSPGNDRNALIVAYNFGRIFSYSVAGLLVGFISALSLPGATGTGYLVLQVLASLFLVVLGLHVMGYLPQLKVIERAGMRVWNILKPLTGKLLPINSVYRALVAGSIWGWLPCGLVYSVLLWTLSSTHPVKGALYMLSFGLGTLPAMIATGIFGGTIFSLGSTSRWKRLSGALIITLAIASLVFNLSALSTQQGSGQHDAHMHH